MNRLRTPGSATWTPLWFPGVHELSFSGTPTADHPALWLARCLSAYSRLGVKYIVSPPTLPLSDAFAFYGHSAAPPLRFVYRGEAYIWENTGVAPRAFVADRVRIVPSQQEAFAAFGPVSRGPCPDAPEPAAVSVEEPLPVVAATEDDTRTSHSRVDIVGYSDLEVALHAVLDRPGVAVLTDNYYPGWEVAVDGQSAKVLRVNGLFRGVVLPPGTHQVVFRYRPYSISLGLQIAVLTVITFLATAMLERRLARRPRSAISRGDPRHIS